MIIVCSGPDTYRARARAADLVAAFRAKHDPGGLAIDVLQGPVELSDVLSRLGSASLFAKRKMVRVDGLLGKMKIADVRALAAKLEADKDTTVVLTVEEEAPTDKVLQTLKAAPLHHYPFPVQSGTAFRAWVRERAGKMEVETALADQIAEYAEGDSWLAMSELEKAAVFPEEWASKQAFEEAQTVFDAADAVLLRRNRWRAFVSAFKEEGLLSVALSQARSFLRIRDGKTEGIHPYVVKKLGTLRPSSPEERTSALQRCLVGSRTGLMTENEADTIL